MPDEYERLRRRIEEGLAAADELQRKLEAAEREDRRERKRQLRLIRGGLIWGAVMTGVEWFRNYRRLAGALAVSGLTVTGAVIADQPGSPGSDPPQVVIPPAAVRPSAHPVRPKAAPTPTGPPRTSPPRTPTRSSTPVATPDPTRPTAKPTRTATRPPTNTPPPATASIKPPVETLTEATTAVPSLVPTPTPGLVAPSTHCTINLLGVKVCLPRG